MRALIVVVVVVAALFLIGWLSFNRQDGQPSITVETEAIQEDTSTMVESGKELLQSADEKLDEVRSDEVEVEVETEPAATP